MLRSIVLAVLATLVASLPLAAPSHAARKPKKPKFEVKAFDSATAALASLLPLGPRVIGFGEYHEIESGPKARAAIVHMLDELLPILTAGSSDLILETWITEGRCGKKEKEVVKNVQETTERPEETESEIVTLIKKAKAAGVQPHILTVSCIEYFFMSDGKGGVDYIKLLATLTDLLKKKIDWVMEERAKQPPRTILVYGGAMHNDLKPRTELRDYTWAPYVKKKVKGKYLEVDLYVPEYIAADEYITEEAWYPEVAKLPAGATALVKRAPDSYIIVFAKGAPEKEAPKQAKPDPISPPDGGVVPVTDGGTRG